MRRQPRSTKVLTILLVVMALITIFPLAMMLLNSVKSNYSVITNPLGLPRHLHLANYMVAWRHGNLGPALLLSAEVVLMTVVFTGVTVSLSAYSIARKKFRAWPIVGGYFLVVTTVPLTLLIFPLYEILVRLNLVGSPVVLALVYTALYTPFSMFLLRGYFLGVPIQLEEAARVDGAGSFQIFRHVVVPIVLPGVLTIVLVVGLFSWNEFLLALTFFLGAPVKTAVVQFYAFQAGFQSATPWNIMMAAGVIIVFPIIVLFVFLQRRFVDGIASGGVKG